MGLSRQLVGVHRSLITSSPSPAPITSNRRLSLESGPYTATASAVPVRRFLMRLQGEDHDLERGPPARSIATIERKERAGRRPALRPHPEKGVRMVTSSSEAVGCTAMVASKSRFVAPMR